MRHLSIVEKHNAYFAQQGAIRNLLRDLFCMPPAVMRDSWPMKHETCSELIDRLNGMRALLATWAQFKGKPVYDNDYVSDLDKRCQCLEMELKEGSDSF